MIGQDPITGRWEACCEEPGCEARVTPVQLVLSTKGAFLYSTKGLGGWQRVINQRLQLAGVDPPIMLRCPAHKLAVATAGIVLQTIPLPEPVVGDADKARLIQ
jgi:hypothetical protein